MSTSKPNASQAAISLARQHELDLGTIEGTGSGEQVTKADVKKAINKIVVGTQASQTPADPAAPPAPQDIPVSKPEPQVSKGDTAEIVRARNDLNGFWACPFDDVAQPLDYGKCAKCGAERAYPEQEAQLGEEVTAA